MIGSHDGPNQFGRRGLLAGGVVAGLGSAAAIAGLLEKGTSPRDSPIELTANDPDASLPLNYVNVKAAPFNAGGVGATDDTAAIARAYQSAAANGRPMFFPAGNYKVTSLPAMANNMTILGAGAGLSTIIYEGSGTLLSLSNAQHVTFKNIGFWITGASGTGISLSNCFRCSFESVMIRGQHSAANTTGFRAQTGVVLTANTGGTSFLDCDINNLGTGMKTSCIQNYVANSKFATNYVGILGTGNNLNAGMSLMNTEFVSNPSVAETNVHIYIDGRANDWWLTNCWFEGANKAIVVGVAGVGGPSQFGMSNCKVAGKQIVLDLQYCRQPHLSNVVFDADPGGTPTLLRINASSCPDGVAINLINSQAADFASSVFPPNWTVIGRRRFGSTLVSPNGHSWQLKVSDSGAVTASDLGVI
ncbi:glycosyl hydrolase family 28-related protein [Williamsia phyllosphaerae]|uniref:Rhamnogalacturonase A/B/Epimerase-like pectate lyase domain-containing protein n=1 Tax=Williamsia phyllosphaerae TaxID=885042 RepID=A0ABQ1UBA5_9NOCA|nr:glycosyl hydrolase family 28-related protein [Williamsia phyllosphaerae]GGF12903.1 hypothetical protein GCM10007298_06010 [Williamsia phyllosphaerae]